MTARVVGAMAVILIIRRPPAYKVAFNTGMLLFEVAVAVLVFRGHHRHLGEPTTVTSSSPPSFR